MPRATRPPRTTRALTLAAVLATLGLLLLSFLPAAGAKTARSQGACAAAKRPRHAGRGGASRSCQRHASKPKTKHKKRTATGHHSHRPTVEAAAETTPATCEDESLPIRGSGRTYLCDDGSEPSCEDGAFPTLLPATGQPVCRTDPSGSEAEASGAECEAGTETDCAAAEFDCEDPSEEGASSTSCEEVSGAEAGDSD